MSQRFDYLKYWRVIRKFYCTKYDLSLADLEMILFLYSEDYFSYDKFEEYDTVMPWDKKRFQDLINRGIIEVFRKKVPGRKALYDLSMKHKRMVANIYSHMNGKPLPESVPSNRGIWTKSCYTNKVYNKAIKEMNAELRKIQRETNPSPFSKQRRRPSPE